VTPTLSTQDLVLKELRRATRRQVEMVSDLQTVQMSELRHSKHTLASCQKYLDGVGRAGGHVWTINLVSTGEHIGNVTAYVDVPNEVAEMSILIAKDFWRRGYGLQAWQAVSDWLLQTRGGVRKIEAGAMAINEGIIQILRKCRFQLEGERRSHFLLDGLPVGLLHFGRFQ